MPEYPGFALTTDLLDALERLAMCEPERAYALLKEAIEEKFDGITVETRDGWLDWIPFTADLLDPRRHWTEDQIDRSTDATRVLRECLENQRTTWVECEGM
jgi:hypothetical protein